MESIAIFVLAAGRGKRMGMDMPKVLAETGSGALIHHVLNSASTLSPEKVLVVTGHGRDQVEKAVVDGASEYGYSAEAVSFVNQKEQLGTGDAARHAFESLGEFQGTVVILSGDVPLIDGETLKALLQKHADTKATVSLISARTEKPGSYGRVIREAADSKGRKPVSKIVEAKDATEEELLCNEINSGIYAIDSAFLGPALSELTNDNAQGELYLTDVVERAVKEGQTVSAYLIDDIEEVQGVNTPADLTVVLAALKKRRVQELLASGVIIDDPQTTYVDAGVEIEAGVRLGPQVQLHGSTRLKTGVVIEGNAYLKDTTVGEGTILKYCVRAEEALVGKNCMIGPFAQLRPGAELADDVRIGNFVEIKNSKLAKGAKANHLAYLGDSEIGANVNIGAGTITCNYDGYNKSKTVIGDGASTGSNSSLIAPVTIGAGAYVGAGSVISKDVEQDALALSRAEQKVYPGWSRRRREKMEKAKR
jgi:bifunctional UDP-N-acetylglucosamine pyrophosphorylase/glucosamine-1-phosphate N-acetyltransferase